MLSALIFALNMLKGVESSSTLMIWRQLVAEREKFLISLRLALAASIIFWAVMWSIQATFKMGYEEIEFDFGLLNLVTITLSAFLGLSLATTMEVLVFKDLVRKWPFRTAILFKTIASLGTVFILVLSGLVLYIYFFDGFPRVGSLKGSWSTLFEIPIFWGSVLYWSAILDINFFFSSVHNVTGSSLFTQYTRGRFYKPFKQQRVFLFVDMDSSVNTAERLGNELYFNLLNEVYYDFSFPIQYHGAEIYQYVGDEVVLSWEIEEGIKANTCVKLFYDMQEVILNNKEKYETKYGVVPSFKGALHCGETTVGEVGYLRTAILYSGDVINTSARLERLAGKLKKKLVVSSDLLKTLNQEELKAKTLGHHALVGIQKPMEVFEVSL